MGRRDGLGQDTAPLPLTVASLLLLGLAGGLLALLAYPAYAQDGDEPLTARFLADTGPSNHGGDGQEFTIRIQSHRTNK